MINTNFVLIDHYLSIKLNPQLCLQSVHFVGRNGVNMTVGVLENGNPSDFDLDLVWDIAWFLQLLLEVFIFSLVISTVRNSLTSNVGV